MNKEELNTELLYVIKGIQNLYNECYTHRGHSRQHLSINKLIYDDHMRKLLAIMKCNVDKEFAELKKLLK